MSNAENFTEFRHDSPRFRTVLTENGGAQIRAEMLAAGLRRAVIVCSARETRSPLFRCVREALAELCAGVFDGSQAHPTLADAERGANLVRKLDADCLIALGGGSVSDQAKGIALWVIEDGNLRPISVTDPGPRPSIAGSGSDKAALPVIALPTTASGAELTPGFAQRDAAGHKLIFRDERLFVRLVVLDPGAAAQTPSEILIPSCMNAIAHCVEALYSRARDPISDAYAVSGFALLHRALGRLLDVPNWPAGYRDILIGANLAGRAIVSARTGIHHAICHVLGGAGVSHGVANAIMLPHVILFNAEAGGRSLDPLASLLPGEEAGPAKIAASVDSLCRDFDIPRKLRDIGIEAGRVSELVSRVTMEPGLRFNPRQNVTPGEIADLIRQAW